VGVDTMAYCCGCVIVKPGYESLVLKLYLVLLVRI